MGMTRLEGLQRGTISLAHGGGGSKATDLLENMIWPTLGVNERGEDAAVAGPVLVSTDSYVVRPLVFPGGDIGKLAVCGTVNDLAMRGGRPLALTVALVVEEGIETELLAQILHSLRETADECGVSIVGGDTKVVEAGRGDGIFINTAGVALPLSDVASLPSLKKAVPGDVVLLNGPIGEHGIAVIAAREQLDFAADVKSDCAPLHQLAAALIGELGPDVHCLHDPTRGGLAAALNEIAAASDCSIVVEEASVPVTGSVAAACEILGFDVLEVANEGKMVAVVDAKAADRALDIMRDFAVGRRATAIGEITDAGPVRVTMRTELGTVRVVAMPSGELLPRIC